MKQWLFSVGGKPRYARWDGVLDTDSVELREEADALIAQGVMVECAEVGYLRKASFETRVRGWGTITRAVVMVADSGSIEFPFSYFNHSCIEEDDVEKASFSSRSEAGRYAANQRWKGNAKQEGAPELNGIEQMKSQVKEMQSKVAEIQKEQQKVQKEIARANSITSRRHYLGGLRNKSRFLDGETRDLFNQIAPLIEVIQRDADARMSTFRQESRLDTTSTAEEFGDKLYDLQQMSAKVDASPWGQDRLHPEPDLQSSEPEKFQKLRDRWVVADDPTLKMNKALRGEAPMTAGDKARASEAKWLTKGVAPEPFVVTRTMSLPLEMAMSIKKGLVFESKGYQASERGIGSIYNRQQQNPGSIHTRMFIQVPEGSHMADVGYGEIILRPGRLKIVASDWDGEQLDVIAELVPQEA